MAKRVKRERMLRPFGIRYYHTGISWTDRYIAQITASPTLMGARSRVTWWIGREDYYPRAIIYDRRTGEWIYRYWRKVDGSIERKVNEEYRGI